jgi:hypothetical protein
MSIAFPLGATVRFTQHRLSILTPRDRRGLEGRIGTVQTDGNLVKKPTVYFPAVGGQLELRLFRVQPGHLELVESPPDVEVTPQQAVGANQTTPDGSSNLSQSEMDDLFG